MISIVDGSEWILGGGPRLPYYLSPTRASAVVQTGGDPDLTLQEDDDLLCSESCSFKRCSFKPGDIAVYNFVQTVHKQVQTDTNRYKQIQTDTN